MNGFVPIIHNADIPIKETLNKFPLKKNVQCRVKEIFLMKKFFEQKTIFSRFYKLIHLVND